MTSRPPFGPRGSPSADAERPASGPAQPSPRGLASRAATAAGLPCELELRPVGGRRRRGAARSAHPRGPRCPGRWGRARHAGRGPAPEDHTRAGSPEEHPGQPAKAGPQRGLELVADHSLRPHRARPQDILVVDEELHEVDGVVDGAPAAPGTRPAAPTGPGRPARARASPRTSAWACSSRAARAGTDDPGREVGSAIADHEVGGELGRGPRRAQRRRVGTHRLEGVAEGGALEPGEVGHAGHHACPVRGLVPPPLTARPPRSPLCPPPLRPSCGGAWPSSASAIRRQPRWFALAVVGQRALRRDDGADGVGHRRVTRE